MIRFIFLFISLLISQSLFAQGLFGLNDKVLVYEALFIEANGETLTREKVECQFTSIPWTIKSQKEVVFVYFTDTVGIKNFAHPFEKVGQKHERNQRKKEQQKSGWENWTWLEKKDVTGYILNDSIFWLHPPRANQYLHNELSGMPHIELNKLAVGKSWQSKLVIMMGWHDFKGTVLSSYRVKGNKAYNRESVSVSDAWEIEVSHAHSNLGQYQSSILFDEKQYGFLRFDNSFHDGRRIILSLIELKTKPDN